MQVHEGIPKPAANSTALREALGVFTAIAALTWLLARLQALPILRTHLHLIVGTLFLFAALRSAERLPGGLPRYGLALGGLFAEPEPATEEPRERGAVAELLLTIVHALPSFATELGVAALTCALVFPPFIAGFYLWHAPQRSFVWLPERDLLSYVLTQVMVVALPEEALFRGYLQNRLRDALPGRMRWLRVDLSLRAWLIQAALFALLHVVVDYNPARLAVFFPALLFGWLAALRGGIGAAVLVHAACNFLSDVLVRGWL